MNRRKALAEQMIWNDEIQRNEAYKIRIKEGGAVDYCIQWAKI